MNKRNIAIIVLFIVLIGAVYYFTKGTKINDNSANDNVVVAKNEESMEEEAISKQEIAVGKEAPNFTLKNLDGDEVSLKDYRGKMVLINFWATWCKYCDQEMPDLQKFDKDNEDIVILAVDVKENKNIVENYINKGGYTFPVLLDEKGEIATTYLVSAFPTSYFIDEDGILLGAVPGMMTYPQMNQILDQLRGNK